MSISGNPQEQGLSRARGILGAVLVAWLNLALQPCAMALEAEQDHDCPHHPPAQSQHNDGHDMATYDSPCATSASDCDVLDDWTNNERKTQVKFKDIPKDLPASVAPAVPKVRVNQLVELTAISLSMIRPKGASPPLHKLYCVYLD